MGLRSFLKNTARALGLISTPSGRRSSHQVDHTAALNRLEQKVGSAATKRDSLQLLDLWHELSLWNAPPPKADELKRQLAQLMEELEGQRINPNVSSSTLLVQRSQLVAKQSQQRQQADQERQAREEAERQAKQAEAQRAAEEAEKLRQERDRLAREEAERQANEAEARRVASETERQRLEQERQAREEAAHQAEVERQERERLAQLEADQQAKEHRWHQELQRQSQELAERQRLEQERLAREAAERLVREDAERQAREAEAQRAAQEAQRLQQERERLSREEAERQAKEAEAKRAAAEAERNRLEQERLAREEAERLVREDAERQARVTSNYEAREKAPPHGDELISPRTEHDSGLDLEPLAEDVVSLKDFNQADAPASEPGQAFLSWLTKPIDDLSLSMRASNALLYGGFRSVSDLAGKQPEDLLRVRNFGQKSLDELIQCLERQGIPFPVPLDFKTDQRKHKSVANVNLDKGSRLSPAVLLRDLDIPQAALGPLMRHGFHTLGDLAERSESDLAQIRNLGPRGINSIRKSLAVIGLDLPFKPSNLDPDSRPQNNFPKASSDLDQSSVQMPTRLRISDVEHACATLGIDELTNFKVVGDTATFNGIYYHPRRRGEIWSFAARIRSFGGISITPIVRISGRRH